MVGSSRFLGKNCHTSFLLLLLSSVEYSETRKESLEIWNNIKKEAILNGNYGAIRSSLISIFASIFGKNIRSNSTSSGSDIAHLNHPTTNPNKSVDERDNENENENRQFVKRNFSHFFNGNNENILQEVLRLFLGLGSALGKTNSGDISTKYQFLNIFLICKNCS